MSMFMITQYTVITHCVCPQEKLLWFAGIKTGEYAHMLATPTVLTGLYVNLTSLSVE